MQDVVCCTCDGGVLQDGVNDDVVAVYFLEGYFPFAMAFLAVARYLREEGGAILEPQLTGVFDSFGQRYFIPGIL